MGPTREKINFSILNIHLFIWRKRERETQTQHMGEGQREVDRIPSRLSTEPDVGLELPNSEIMTWAETKNPTLSHLSHPAPQMLVFAREEEEKHKRGAYHSTSL